MKIGKFVQRHAAAILAQCETADPSEFARLQDARYSKETFDINYPFCKPVVRIGANEHVRFYNAVHKVRGVPVRITSQWFNPPTSRSLPLLRRYLDRRGIAPDMGVAADAAAVGEGARAPRGRYRASAIGNAQNAFIRHLLGRIGDEQFSAARWQGVITDFGHRCAYCGAEKGAEGDLVMDHVIAINRAALGEHRLGNLVPACRACNAAKADQDYRSVLAHDPDRLAAIAAHMARHGYAPIRDNPKLGQIVEMAHHDIRQLADRYAAIIDAVLETEDRMPPGQPARSAPARS